MTNPSYFLEVSEEGVIVFPDELMERMNWKENDELFFRDLGNGTFHISTVPYDVEDLTSEIITPVETDQDEA
jgi:bifunctional DNA-binding transcriptional regulator/antitoxin component of YhaV-PrlF toxin-antitoxin module